MNKTLKERENDILEQFAKVYKSDISRDGLHFLGEISSVDGNWERKEGNEEELWNEFCEKKKGLVIISKELHVQDAPWDIRLETARRKDVAVPEPSHALFYKNLRNWAYCLLHIGKGGNTPACPSEEQSQEFFEKTPMVRINIQKSPCGGSEKYDTLLSICEDKQLHALLKEQLSLYRGASIYLDCTRKWGITYLMEMYPDLRSFGDGDNEWIYYSEANRFIVINSYHPSYTYLDGENGEEYYKKMQHAIKAFFAEKHDFFHEK